MTIECEEFCFYALYNDQFNMTELWRGIFATST